MRRHLALCVMMALTTYLQARWSDDRTWPTFPYWHQS